MKIVIDIPEEQIKKSLKESEYVFEDEGIKGFVNIVMQYTNGRLEFVDVERRKDFYSCNFTPIPKGHGDLIDRDQLELDTDWNDYYDGYGGYSEGQVRCAPVIIEADKKEVNKKIANAKPSSSLFKELAEIMTEEEIQEIVTEAKEKAREQISEIESEHAVLCNNFTESSQDCISRKAVNKLKKYRFSYDTNTTIPKSDVFVKISDITNLPSVNPPRPEGKWIHNNCSICNYNVNPWNNTPYCPNCGAKMEESEGRK